MLVTFKSLAHADIVMFTDVARKLLRTMGRDDAVPGAMYPEDVPFALDELRNGLAAEPAKPEVSGVDGDARDDDLQEEVLLTDRARPLIQMLEAASAEQVHVMWSGD